MLSTGQSLPLPGRDDVHIWHTCLPLDSLAPCEARLLPTLSHAEQQRIRQIRATDVRQEAVLIQAGLRRLLGCYLDSDGAKLRFVRGPYGKPALPPEYPPLQFNATYTPGLLAIAIASEREVGIDGESLQRPVSPLLFRKALAPEEQAACNLRTERFLALWTLKEAYLKCIGVGLRVRPSKVAFDLDGPTLLRPAPGYETLQVQCWRQPVCNYSLALVAAGAATPPLTFSTHDLGAVLSVNG